MMCNHEKLNAPTAIQRNIHLIFFLAKEEEGKLEKCLVLLALTMITIHGQAHLVLGLGSIKLPKDCYTK